MNEFHVKPEKRALVEKFIKLEKADHDSIVIPEKIKEFKDKYKALLPTLKLNKKDKFAYENGELFIQRADGSILVPSSANMKLYDDSLLLNHYKVSKEPDIKYFKEINGEKYKLVDKYKITPNGIIKYRKNSTIEIDKKAGEIIITKGDYKYYYSIKDRELLDIKKIEPSGKPVDLKSYNPAKSSKSGGDDTPEIILIKLRGGGTAQLYKMPSGEILTPFEFHFPGAARAQKDFQQYLKQLEQLREHEREMEIQRRIHSHYHSDKEREVTVYK